MCKLCWTLVLVLLLAVAGMAYKFILQGSVEESDDGRLALQLTSAEKNLVLGEMRTFLASVQQITHGVVNEDMEMIVKAGKAVGMAAQQGVPGSLVGKLPLAFKKLGFDTHSKFDQLALDAEQLGDKEHALKQLGQLMQNCVACHAAYRIDVAPEN